MWRRLGSCIGNMRANGNYMAAIRCAVLVAIANCCCVSAQRQRPASFVALLPAGAEIIETADLSTIASKPRVMALWMLNPERHFDDRWDKNREGGYCSDILHGDFGKLWKGPTRLSLIDSEKMDLINTIEIREGCIACGQGRDTFTLPLCVLSSRFRLRDDLSDLAGRPNMYLRDFIGSGLKTEFALFIFEAYGIADTGVFGYDQRRIVWCNTLSSFNPRKVP
jgi:hypothetical protein